MNLDLFASKVSSRRALLKTYWKGLSLTGDPYPNAIYNSLPSLASESQADFVCPNPLQLLGIALSQDTQTSAQKGLFQASVRFSFGGARLELEFWPSKPERKEWFFNENKMTQATPALTLGGLALGLGCQSVEARQGGSAAASQPSENVQRGPWKPQRFRN